MGQYKHEDKVLKNDQSVKYRTPDGYTADIAIFTLIANESKEETSPNLKLALMLIKRALLNNEGEPNAEGGKWALPGGFIQPDETAYVAAKRELKEETGVDGIHIKHFGVYDKPGRDKRGWMITNAHYAIVPKAFLHKRVAADDAAEVQLHPIDELFQLELAFDHKDIIEDAICAVKKDMLLTTIAKSLLPAEFKLEELRNVLLAVVDEDVIKNKSSFYEKAPCLPFITEILDSKCSITEPTDEASKLYRFTDADVSLSIWG